MSRRLYQMSFFTIDISVYLLYTLACSTIAEAMLKMPGGDAQSRAEYSGRSAPGVFYDCINRL